MRSRSAVVRAWSRRSPPRRRQIPDELERPSSALYRESRDDLFAYVAGLLRDRAAAEDVTALAFERACRKRRTFDPEARAHAAPGCSGSPATPRSTSCAAAGARPSSATSPPTRRGDPGREAADVGAAPGRPAAAMASLSSRERELVALKFFAGLANAEIAR